MKKISLELPKWSDERIIHVLAGIEHVAKRDNGVWYIKKDRCNLCGVCCMNVSEGWPHGQNPDTGHCQHLWFEGKLWRCLLGTDRPYVCCVSEGEEGECSITWQKVE